ncbi:ABC transporter permease [Streptococcus iniae]|uniref:ABC transporter permease n=2 Tax=Streptococcus iniae TaxID=1346 RepID=A0A1J0MYU2_STRIN|nr:ABC transporter permease [Streptococcus iniae]AGM98804.1 efflux ABC transporter, permease protein [Streptococcus iniae SF1]AHY15767.1 ABC transporter permease [Streptococcus iniae]AHY17634.1 ABC transporter permease [Streptococcus iniae]APD31806.1 ABC transporter permease [Streptococcus iniae]ASL34749.1 bacitracin export permease BceB [Streptococcus iniae]
MFYLKLAWNNLRKSKATVAPFLLASTVLYTFLAIVFLILLSPMTKSMSYGNSLLGLAIVVLIIFSIVMEIYSYNFLLKQRSREFGLYNILGMTKKQVGLVSTIELIILFFLTIVGGSVFSAIFSHLFYLIFVNLVHYNHLQLDINVLAFVFNSGIFAAIFIILEFVALRTIKKSSPLSLFQTASKGEKEPKGNLLLALLSVIFIGAGYYLSLSSTKIAALAVLYRFFIAVVFVIIGTYLFYISFMTWYLKRKKADKIYYYKPEHFITTSQMIFRMKENALGLANITLLAVMAFVSIATTTALYNNSNDMTNKLFPKNTNFDFFSPDRKTAEEQFKHYVAEPLALNSKVVIAYQSSMVGLPIANQKKVTINSDDITSPAVSKLSFVFLISEKDFISLGNKKLNLKEGEIAFYRQKGDSQLEALKILDQTYRVTENFKSLKFPNVANTYNPSVMILRDRVAVEKLLTAINKISHTKLEPVYSVYVDLSKEQVNQLHLQSSVLVDGDHSLAHITQKHIFYSDILGMVGGFVFTGFLLGLTFILGAALIIYYKQYSEGYQDKKSYHILQEVGMSQSEVRKTINSQIILVFFMPIVMAVLHFMIALVMIKQMLLIFGVDNTSSVYSISALTIIGIIILYYAIYRMTSRIYYKIIER